MEPCLGGPEFYCTRMASSQQEAPESAKRSGLALTSLQHRLITTALAALSLFVICALLFVLFQLLNAFVNEFSNVLMPLAVAGILSMLLRPVVDFLVTRTRISRLGSIILLLSLVLLILTVFLWFIIPVIIEQSIQFIQSLPAIYEGLRQVAAERFPQLMQFLNETLGEERLSSLSEQVQEHLGTSVQKLIIATASVGKATLVSVVSIAAAIGIIPVYLFFFLRSDPPKQKALEKQLSWIPGDMREDIFFLGKQFLSSIETFFQGQILVGLIMGALLAIGFSVAGVNFGFVIGLFIGLLNIIPYLGTIIGLSAVLPIAYLQPGGGLLLVGIALGIFIAVQVIEGYLLTPRIMGNRTGLHPLTIIIAIFFWGTALDGLLGMILAIPLTAFFVVAWRLLREKYLNRWTRADA
jgi:predicted PurR-regulated permease PerM